MIRTLFHRSIPRVLARGFGLLSLLIGLTAADKPVETDQQDLIYFSSQGPIRIRLLVSSDGQAVSTRWNKFVDQLISFYDANNDGKLNKDETAKLLTFPLKVWTTPPKQADDNADEDEPENRISFTTLDSNKDGQVDRSELTALFKKQGLNPLQVNMTAPLDEVQQRTDALCKILDSNKDKKLSKEELLQAPEQLLKLDTNEDEVISIDELLERPAAAPQQFIARPEEEGEPANPITLTDFLAIDSQAKPEEIAKQMVKFRGSEKATKLKAKDLGVDAKVFATLDKNKDQFLDIAELAEWAKQEPHLQLQVPLGAMKNTLNMMSLGTRMVVPSMTALSLPKDSPLAHIFQKGSDGVSQLVFSDATIRFSISTTQETTVMMRVQNETEQLLNRFKDLAGKANFIEKKQLGEEANNQALAQIFDQADRNSNGKLEYNELKAYTDLKEAAKSIQVSLQVVAQGANLFDLIDSNHDGRLSQRELRNTVAILATYDRQNKGIIPVDQIPVQFAIGMQHTTALSNTNTNGNLVVRINRSQVEQPRPVKAPAWFLKMDRNSDGDISPKEFLGPPELFQKLDLDQDGLISAEEATKAESSAKKN